MNAAMYSNNSNSTYDSAEEAYQSIIYTITHGGDMHRPSTADREEIHFRSAKDVKKAQKYLMDLINTDIREKYNKETNEPSIAPVATPTPAPAPVASSPATSEPTPAPAPSVAPAQKSPEARKAFDNSQFFQEHKDQIDKINLDDKNPLKLLLDAYKKTQSYNNIVAIQTELKKGTNALVVDGDFGENTLKTLLEQTNPNTQTESGVDIDIHNQTSTSRIL